MKIFSENDYSKIVSEKGAYFLSLLKALQSKHPEVGNVDGLGMAFRMEMCEADGFTPSRALADRMFQRGLEGNLQIRGREFGLVLDIGGYYKNVVTIAPSFEISREEMHLAHDLLELLICECKR